MSGRCNPPHPQVRSSPFADKDAEVGSCTASMVPSASCPGEGAAQSLPVSATLGPAGCLCNGHHTPQVTKPTTEVPHLELAGMVTVPSMELLTELRHIKSLDVPGSERR